MLHSSLHCSRALQNTRVLAPPQDRASTIVAVSQVCRLPKSSTFLPLKVLPLQGLLFPDGRPPMAAESRHPPLELHPSSSQHPAIHCHLDEWTSHEPVRWISIGHRLRPRGPANFPLSLLAARKLLEHGTRLALLRIARECPQS